MARIVELRAHPTTPDSRVASIDAEVDRSDDALLFRFRLRGEAAALAIPERRESRSVSGLWRHTCFEAFVAIAGDDSYHEWNFSPSSEWAAHVFRGYRQGGFVDDESLRPAIESRFVDGSLELAARIELRALSSRHPRAALDVGLSAVVEATDGSLSYWALAHPGERPDFHRREAFTLRLEAREC